MTSDPHAKDADLRLRFPGICRAALEIAYDNGGINRGRTEADCIRELGKYLKEHWLSSNHAGLRTTMYVHLKVIDDWLNGQADEMLITVCCGEDSEAQAAVASAPRGTNDLLNGIFENVC